MSGIIAEIREFLASLKDEAPELFKEERLAARPRRESSVENARALFTSRAQFWSQRMGVRFNRIFIKEQRTLWGSCSVKGNLNFNWRVASAPEPVIDYLVIHELAHLLEMNHSRRFWGHVAKQCPDYKAQRKWLRVNGALLKTGGLPEQPTRETQFRESARPSALYVTPAAPFAPLANVSLRASGA